MFRITQMNIQNKNFKAKTVDREQNPRIIKKQNIKQNLSLNLTNVRNQMKEAHKKNQETLNMTTSSDRRRE